MNEIEVYYVENEATECPERPNPLIVSETATIMNSMTRIKFTKEAMNAKMCIHAKDSISAFTLIDNANLRINAIRLETISSFYPNSNLRYVAFDSIPISFTTTESRMTTRRYISGIQSSWFANGCGRVSQPVEEESFSIVNANNNNTFFRRKKRGSRNLWDLTSEVKYNFEGDKVDSDYGTNGAYIYYSKVDKGYDEYKKFNNEDDTPRTKYLYNYYNIKYN